MVAGLSPDSFGSSSTRDRLLLAAATLLDAADGGPVSTRAICELAGVQAPTLYHHFGSKQGLVDAVVNHGFTQYVRAGEHDSFDSPIDAIRAGWHRHVQFGLEHPGFYAMVHGAVVPGRMCAIAEPAREMLRGLLDECARRGMLRVSPVEAAEQLFAANVGVTLSLIGRPAGEPDSPLSARMLDSVLGGILAPAGPDGPTPDGGESRARAAISLRAALDSDPAGLTFGESAILRELLDRLAAE